MPRSPVEIHEEPTPDAGARERILMTACKLFYEEGIQAVGIQRLIDEAGIAKASLYAHFASKDELVAAYLERRSQTWQALVAERLANPRLTARTKLLRLFDVLVEWAEGLGFRGCPFQNLGSEITDEAHPAKRVSRAHRAWWNELLHQLVREADVAVPDRVASALGILFDGAAAATLVDGNRGAARQARWAAERLLDAGDAQGR